MKKGLLDSQIKSIDEFNLLSSLNNKGNLSNKDLILEYNSEISSGS